MSCDVKHWYAYAFFDNNDRACTYVGHIDNVVTKPRIEEAKVAAGVGPNAVLVGVSYLGLMTKHRFTAP